MRSGWWLVASAQLVLAAATIPFLVPGLGEPTWHHTATLGATLAFFAFALWRTPDRRRHAAIGTTFWTLLALVTGFLILYLKPELKATGYKDWAKFWHVAWSWMALWYAAAHTWINWYGLRRAWTRLTGAVGPTVAFIGPLLLIGALVPLTWSRWGADHLQEPQFIPLTLWTWVGFLAVPYGLWVVDRLTPPDFRAASFQRGPVQHFVTAWLIPMTWLANITGIPIVYMATKDTSLKYVAKYWHTWPSIAMAVLVFVHTIQWWPGLVSHWRARRPA